MAQMTGYQCDECGAFQALQPDEAKPTGWLTLTVVTKPGMEKKGQWEDGWDLCSNKCLLAKAKARCQSDKPDGRVANAKAANLIRWHKEGKHDKDPNPECPMCEEATSA